MNILIKQALVIDPNSKHHKKKRDILIINGKFKKIAKSIKSLPKSIKNGTKIEYSAKNLHVSPGWFDLHVNFGEPGYEQKETFLTGINSAIKGGYTGVLLSPNTNPNIDNRSTVEYIKNINQKSIIDILPSGNVTISNQGEKIVEMHEMSKAGCVAFTDDKHSIIKNNVLKVALLYAKDCNRLIMNFPNDKDIANNGSMHEGEVSTKLGLKGIPSIAEEIMVNRDISLCSYTNSKLHLSYLSIKESVKKVKEAKNKKLPLTSDVCLYNLFLNDKYLNDFDSRYKTLPPLRTIKDNKALIKGLKEGVIDAITTDHRPHEEEVKKIEFDYAKEGIIGLESSFGLLCKHILPHLNISELIEKISINPRKILNIHSVSINEGEDANITLFDPTKKWIFKKEDVKSKSNNTPFIGEEMHGQALAIYNNKKFTEC